MAMRKYDGVVIDPIWIDIAGRDEETLTSLRFSPFLYGLCCRASYIFQHGDWLRRRRIAEAGNDFEALDRLDKEYERLGA